MSLKGKTFLGLASLAAILTLTGCGAGSSSPVAAPAALTMFGSSADFGDVAVGSTRTMALTFANSGGQPLTLQQLSSSGAAFTASGVGSSMTLQPGQYMSLLVSFTPASSGSSSGSISLGSSTSSSPISLQLTGNGIVPDHSAALTWDPSSSSNIVGYNVYRTSNSGSWQKINAAPLTTTSYTDWDFQVANSYSYAATAVNSSNAESDFSVITSPYIP